MFDSKDIVNLLGSILANINNILLIFLFIARIYKYPRIEYWLGILFMLSIVPLVFMFIKAIETKRELLYFVQLFLMISFIVIEFILDYFFKIDFRHNINIVIPFLTLFYGSLGGMIGIASQSGKQWTIVTVVTFLLMTALSLLMHYKTDS
jgi:hypothetical protein